MKNVLMLMLIFIATIAMNEIESKPTQTLDEYYSGFDDGFSEGWRDVKGSMSLSPIPPMAPAPDPGRVTYRDGYNKGFKIGRRRALNSRI